MFINKFYMCGKLNIGKDFLKKTRSVAERKILEKKHKKILFLRI